MKPSTNSLFSCMGRKRACALADSGKQHSYRKKNTFFPFCFVFWGLGGLFVCLFKFVTITRFCHGSLFRG